MLTVADLKLDRVQRLVERAGSRIDLTAREYSLLEYLMLNIGRRVTRSMIIEHVWNLTFDTSTNVVDVYINYASAQVDQRKVGRLAMAIQVAFQELGVFPDSNTRIPLNTSEPMPFSTVQVIENVKHNTEVGRIASPPRKHCSRLLPRRPTWPLCKPNCSRPCSTKSRSIPSLYIARRKVL